MGLDYKPGVSYWRWAAERARVLGVRTTAPRAHADRYARRGPLDVSWEPAVRPEQQLIFLLGVADDMRAQVRYQQAAARSILRRICESWSPTWWTRWPGGWNTTQERVRAAAEADLALVNGYGRQVLQYYASTVRAARKTAAAHGIVLAPMGRIGGARSGTA